MLICCHPNEWERYLRSFRQAFIESKYPTAPHVTSAGVATKAPRGVLYPELCFVARISYSMINIFQ